MSYPRTVDRTQVEEHSAPALDHSGQHSPGAQKWPLQHQVKGAVPLILGQFTTGHGIGAGGLVDQDLDVHGVLVCPIDSGSDHFLVRYANPPGSGITPAGPEFFCHHSR
jgi:hypothetical protein